MRSKVFFVVKLLFSVGMLAVIGRKFIGREGMSDLLERVQELSWGWFVAAIGMQLLAVTFATVRWQRLLTGQGIHAPWRFLGGSILIARFWGAFTPGGFTGFGGWRIYDIAKRTGKTARATVTIGVEMVLGQLAFGIVVMGSSIFGFRFIGTEGVILVNAVFTGIILTGLLFLSKPMLLRAIAERLPASIRPRVQSMTDAICAYQGKTVLLAQALALGVGVHAANNLIYVCAARALHVNLGVGHVFFASSLQILATLAPITINGVGVREAAAVKLYPKLGVPAVEAVLIPIVGFAAEMIVSAVGGLVFLLRRQGDSPAIHVDDAEREEDIKASIEPAAPARWPHPAKGAMIGAAAGFVAGVFVGSVEALLVDVAGNAANGHGVLLYAAVLYGVLGTLMGAGLVGSLALAGRWMKRAAWEPTAAYRHTLAAIVSVLALGLGAFRVRRDIFDEELVWKSPKGLLVFAGCLAAAAVLYGLLWVALRTIDRITQTGSEKLVTPWGSLGAAGALFVAIFGAAVALENGPPSTASVEVDRAAASKNGSNILFIVVDTLRADHLPSYGYEAGSTPNLDAFAEDAVRFDQHFANASWTRPSFASILTGRHPASHQTMSKTASLPSEMITLPETLKQAGWTTVGFVTNYNVAPYFNFQQGFDEYNYLEPTYVLGSGDETSKLLFMQFLRKRIAKARGKKGVSPGSAYQDAETVNASVTAWLDQNPAQPWFAFTAYMDPHDPYFEHPYSGAGYARAAHGMPREDEAQALRKLYDGEITYWDEHFGKLIETLKNKDLYDNMTIIVTSDHGEEFFDHGGYWHGTTLYDEQIRVPLFIKLPGAQKGGTTLRHWVQSVDIMPTLLRTLDIDIPKSVQGGDLFQGTDVVYAEESHEGNILKAVREKRATREVKMITANPGNPRGLEPVELFQVDDDYLEQQNLAKTAPDEVNSTMQTLVAASKDAKEGAAKRTTVVLDKEAADRLKALGYAE